MHEVPITRALAVVHARTRVGPPCEHPEYKIRLPSHPLIANPVSHKPLDGISFLQQLRTINPTLLSSLSPNLI